LGGGRNDDVAVKKPKVEKASTVMNSTVGDSTSSATDANKVNKVTDQSKNIEKKVVISRTERCAVNFSFADEHLFGDVLHEKNIGNIASYQPPGLLATSMNLHRMLLLHIISKRDDLPDRGLDSNVGILYAGKLEFVLAHVTEKLPLRFFLQNFKIFHEIHEDLLITKIDSQVSELETEIEKGLL
jgi:hypothetical protein